MFVGGANLEVMDDEWAKKYIADYSLAENKDDPKKNLKLFTNQPGKGSIPGPQNAEAAQSLAK